MLRNILAFSYLAVLSMSFPLDITLLWDQLSTAELCANEQLVARAVLTPFLKCRAASVVLSPAVLIQFVLGHEVTCGIAILIIFSFYTRYDIQVYIEKHKFVCILYIDVRGMLLQSFEKSELLRQTLGTEQANIQWAPHCPCTVNRHALVTTWLGTASKISKLMQQNAFVLVILCTSNLNCSLRKELC